MKLFHLSDLHLGKKLNEFSLYEDQKYILTKLVQLVKAEQPDAVLIAGDVYDKTVPPAEAVQLFDSFLTELGSLQVAVLIISGNHDSAERLAFGARLMAGSGIHMSLAYNGEAQIVTLEDEFGPVFFHLLPFLKPLTVKRGLGLEGDGAAELNTYHKSVAAAVEHLPVDILQRNVLLAHQFVTGAQKCDSEDVNVGGLDNIGAEVFAPFDYVALGHIHSPQYVGADKRLRYCGTPLKYSFSECGQTKSVTVVELGEKGMLDISTIPLVPWRELHKLRGTYDQVMSRDFYKALPVDTDGRLRDFFHITLTDEQDVPDAVNKLRSVYKNLLQLAYDNKRTQQDNQVQGAAAVEQKSELELFGDFYSLQNNQALSVEQQSFLQSLIDGLKEGKQ